MSYMYLTYLVMFSALYASRLPGIFFSFLFLRGVEGVLHFTFCLVSFSASPFFSFLFLFSSFYKLFGERARGRRRKEEGGEGAERKKGKKRLNE